MPSEKQYKCKLLAPEVIQGFRLIPERNKKIAPCKLFGAVSDPATQAALTGGNYSGQAVFFTVNQLDGVGFSRENVTHARALFIDIDKPHSPAGLRALLKNAPAPSLIVESSPHKYHVYWVLADPEPVTGNWFTDQQKRLIKLFGSDGVVHDLPRIMRYPGFYHLKNDPFLVRVVRDTDITYAKDELDTWLDKPAPDTAPITADTGYSLSECAKRAGVTLTGHPHQDTLDVIRKTPEGFRNNTLNHLSFLLFQTILAGDIATGLSDTKHTLLSAAEENGLTTEESKATIASAYKSARRKPKIDDKATANDFQVLDKPPEGQLIPLGNYRKEWMSFLWEGWLPRGECTLFAAQGAVGKSTIALDLACRVTVGAHWPGCKIPADQGAVIYITSEDHYTKVLLPKIELHGGDPRLFLKFIVKDTEGAVLPLDALNRSLPALKDQAIAYQKDNDTPVQLVVVDPIGLALKGNENNVDDVTKTARALNALAASLDCACVAIHHTNKSIEGSAVNRVAGSRAFTTAFRMALGVSMDYDTGEGIFGRLKANLTSKKGTFKYTIESIPVQFDNGLSRDFAHLCWGDYNADDLLENAVTEHSGDEDARSLRELTEEFLTEEAFKNSMALTAGEMSSLWVKALKLPRNTGTGRLRRIRWELVNSGALVSRKVGRKTYYAKSETDMDDFIKGDSDFAELL